VVVAGSSPVSRSQKKEAD